jgi:putative ABC transport system permease protein
MPSESRLFRALLWCYPGDFRDEYGREMALVFADRYRSARSPWTRTQVWIEALTGVLMEAPKEQFSTLFNDIRYALRALRKTPSFSLTALLTLALSIGATTVIFSLLHSMLLSPLPFQQPERVVRVINTFPKLGIRNFTTSVPDFVSYQQRATAFAGLAAFHTIDVTLTGDGTPEHAVGAAVTGNLLTMLGIQPLAGRAFVAAEDQPGRDGVVMISQGLLDRRFGGNLSILGRQIRLDGRTRTLIGILPQQMGFTSKTDVWVPMAADLSKEGRSNHYMTVLGRLKPGVTAAQADQDLNRVCAALGREFPGDDDGWQTRLVPVLDWIVGPTLQTSLWVLLAAVGLLLLVASANIGNLLLTRASARQQEMSVRLALGASRVRILRQLLTENLVLAILGGLAGLGLAVFGMKGLQSLLPVGTPRAGELAVGSSVLLFTAGVTVAAAILFGFAPAWMVSRSALNETLRASGRSHSERQRLRQVLVAGQVALATVLVIGTALLLQSLGRLQDAPLGFRPDRILTASINLPRGKYPTLDHAAAFYSRLLADVRALPGVESAGVTSLLPMSGNNSSMTLQPADLPTASKERAVQASWRIASPGTLETFGIELRRGRFFQESESAGMKPIVLSEGLARRIFPDGRDPIQQQVRMGNGQTFTVVGIAGDARHLGLAEDPPPTMYLSSTWYLWPTMVLAVRTTGDPVQITGALRAAVRGIDADQPLFDVKTMRAAVAANAAQPRLRAGLMAAFALLALILGGLGIAGVVAYGVARRTRELALRMALGATPGQVLGHVMTGGARLALAGLVIGLATALGLGRFLSSLLYQVRPNDPVTFSAIGATLLVVSLLACWVPARRAVRIDPATSLRNE